MNNINCNQNESKMVINETNNSKNQLNNINKTSNQNDKTLYINNKYSIYIQPLLLLLQKAEQIISIINLPKSSIDKYNQLKEISFKKCGLEFKPLIKNEDLIKNFHKKNNSIEQSNIKVNKIEKEFSIIKNKLLDLIFGFIKSFESISKNKDNYFNEFNTNCNLLKEEINSIINEGNIKINLDNNSINKEEKYIIDEQEKLLSYIFQAQQNIKSVLYEKDIKFNELKENFLIQNSKIEYLNKYIKNIDELISPIWNKYFNNEVNWFDPNKIIDNYELKTYTKSHFLLNFMNQLFTDNKTLMESFTEMEKKKNELYNILKFPYIRKVIEKGENFKNLENLFLKLKESKKNNMDINKLIRDGKELINCIKDTINNDSKNDNIILNNDDDNNNDIDSINDYNDELNIFLGKLMNGIQNVLNKVDISIKKDELIESMLKINLSKHKNNNSGININNNVSNIQNRSTDINNILNIGNNSKDISLISTVNDINSSKLQNLTFQIYKKKTNHISGSNVIIKNEIEDNDRKDKFGIITNNKKDNNMNVKYENKNQNEEYYNLKNIEKNKNMDNMLINNIIENKDKKSKSYNQKEENEMKNEEINAGKIMIEENIGNNISENNNIELNNYNISKEKAKIKSDEELDALKNMVLEDFKSRLKEEK